MPIGEARELFSDRPAPGSNWLFVPAELAAAVLMAECAYVDGEFATEEREAIWRAVRDEFRLDEETAEWLVEVAEKREDEMWLDRPFSETVRSHFTKDQQIALIRRLWEIALADGTVHPFEERLIARIARELRISKGALAAIRRRSSAPIDNRDSWFTQ
jgi:uncharacterized tellurite resistance protein B-like protein